MKSMKASENRYLRLLSLSYRKDVNKIKISASNTFEHELIKTKICHLLLKNKNKFVTEAIFETGGRADVFDITNGIVYEILHSESLKTFNLKKSYYPNEIREIIGIETKHLITGIIVDNLISIDQKLKQILI